MHTCQHPIALTGKHRTAHLEVLPEAPGLWLGRPTWCTLCCNRLRHSPRQLRVAAEVAFRSSRSWSRAVRGPEPGRDSMACTRFFCCPSTWFIIYKTEDSKEVRVRSSPFARLGSQYFKPWNWKKLEESRETIITQTTSNVRVSSEEPSIH